MCFGNQHTFSWGSATGTDSVPANLRCDCGAVSSEDIAPLRQLQAEVAALRMKVEGQDLLLRAYRLGTRPPERAFTLLKRADAALTEVQR
jgi:hypothetical protein